MFTYDILNIFSGISWESGISLCYWGNHYTLSLDTTLCDSLSVTCGWELHSKILVGDKNLL
jgi:hypothetical protein